MSALANRQRAPAGLGSDRLWPPRGVIATGASRGGIYSLMLGSQTEFWT